MSGRLYVMFGVPIDSRGIGLHQHGPKARLGACCGARQAIWPLQQVLKLSMQVLRYNTVCQLPLADALEVGSPCHVWWADR